MNYRQSLDIDVRDMAHRLLDMELSPSDLMTEIKHLSRAYNVSTGSIAHRVHKEYDRLEAKVAAKR